MNGQMIITGYCGCFHMQFRKLLEQKKSDNGKSISANGSAKTQLQKFEYREISRSQINAAPYNPRVITAHAKKALQRGMENFGCVEPLIWNDKTGNLVGGHQRLKIMDDKEGYSVKSPTKNDYIVGVSVVHLTLMREKKLNVLLNSPGAQGQYDQEGLFNLLEEFKEDDLGDMGLSKMDLELDFGFTPLFADATPEGQAATKDLEENIREIKDRKKKYKDKDSASPNADADYYLMCVFPSRKEKEKFLEKAQCPKNSIFFPYEEWEEIMLRVNG
jgi:hypothetical protein